MDLLWSLLPAVILALVIFRNFRRKNGQYKSFFSLPGPKSLPLIGERQHLIFVSQKETFCLFLVVTKASLLSGLCSRCFVPYFYSFSWKSQEYIFTKAFISSTNNDGELQNFYGKVSLPSAQLQSFVGLISLCLAIFDIVLSLSNRPNIR